MYDRVMIRNGRIHCGEKKKNAVDGFKLTALGSPNLFFLFLH